MLYKTFNLYGSDRNVSNMGCDARRQLALIRTLGLLNIIDKDWSGSAPYPILELTGWRIMLSYTFDEDGIRVLNCFYAVENKTGWSLHCRRQHGRYAMFRAA